MTLLRAGARTMLASYFIVSGVKAVRNPDPLVPAAEPVADRVVPLVKKYAPQQIVTAIPEDTVNLVRANGAAQILGGLALASGKGRRLGALLLAGSLLPSTVAKHPFWCTKGATGQGTIHGQMSIFRSLRLLVSIISTKEGRSKRISLEFEWTKS